MEEKNLINADNIARTRDLLAAMEKGDEAGAREIIDDLSDIRASTLYQDVGKLTRELHDAISAFGMDDRISSMAEHDIPDARERLNFVISKTDDAANRTLSAVEESVPLCEELEKRAAELNEKWQSFINKKMDAENFRSMAKELTEFLGDHNHAAETVRRNLNDVLMAQDFQDLTGQIIKRVINLVAEVEGNLVNLIKLAGLPDLDSDSGVEKKHEKLEGPVVPGVDSGDVVSGQDEVDDLLSSLGF